MIQRKKVGGITFVKVGRVNVSFSVAKRPVNSPSLVSLVKLFAVGFSVSFTAFSAGFATAATILN